MARATRRLGRARRLRRPRSARRARGFKTARGGARGLFFRDNDGNLHPEWSWGDWRREVYEPFQRELKRLAREEHGLDYNLETGKFTPIANPGPLPPPEARTKLYNPLWWPFKVRAL